MPGSPEPRIESPHQLADLGLRAADVADRQALGLVNVQDSTTSRTVLEIVKANLLTRFNAIVSVLSVVILVFGHPIDALFGLVMVANIIIGVGQELRAKRTLDALQILIAPSVTARRDGVDIQVAVGDLVVDEVLHLAAGDQVPVDGTILRSEGLEVDESALTGESRPLAKNEGDDVRSGSVAVAGSAVIVATRVGADAWARRIASEAKEFVLTRSELRAGVDRILWTISWLLPPLAGLLFWSQLRGDAQMADGMVAATAGVVALVPQGLVLLVSMAMAVAVVGLARRSVVVQELHAVEGLARADVICLDKTGTLTTGRTRLEAIEPIGGIERAELLDGLSALAHSEVTPTAAFQVIVTGLGASPGWSPTAAVPFSSDRKWSGASFLGAGTWVLGAPEVLLDRIRSGLGVGEADTTEEIRRWVGGLATEARRVLLVATAQGSLDLDNVDGFPLLPSSLRPVGLIVLAEELRPDAAETMRYFIEQGVSVKVISGDNVETVGAVARELGIPGAEHLLDLRLVEKITPAMVEEAVIFGRVQPEQKRDLVAALQAAGHTVAMTGDGVNDIPALKKADIGIAMDTATSATKAVSQLILLNGRFDLLPSVVAEGRRVVANMERVSSLFVTKTVYAAVFALAVGLGRFDFPFLPRHLTLIDSLTIGIPAFVLSFRGASEPCRTGYLTRVLRFAIPAGLAASGITLATYGLARRWLDTSLEEGRTLATLALASMGFWILYRLVRPLDRMEIVLLIGLLASFGLVVATPLTSSFYALELPPTSVVQMSIGGLVLGAVLLQSVLFGWSRWLARTGRQ